MVLDERGLAVQQRFLRFLQEYRRDDGDDVYSQSQTQGGPPQEYVYMLERIKEKEETTMVVNFQHIVEQDVTLAEAVQLEYVGTICILWRRNRVNAPAVLAHVRMLAVQTHTLTHTHTRTHTHAGTHARTQTHTHARTHAHTPSRQSGGPADQRPPGRR